MGAVVSIGVGLLAFFDQRVEIFKRSDSVSIRNQASFNFCEIKSSLWSISERRNRSTIRNAHVVIRICSLCLALRGCPHVALETNVYIGFQCTNHRLDHQDVRVTYAKGKRGSKE